MLSVSWRLESNSRQMEFIPCCTQVFNDLLFTTPDTSGGTRWSTTYRCIHLPSLVISARLPGGSLSLTENAFAVLLPKCIMESHPTWLPSVVQSRIYSVLACPPTHPRYCFIITRIMRRSPGMEWEVLEVEIDLSIPGPIKVFSRVSQQYTVQRPNYPLYDSDNDILLYTTLGRSSLPCASLSVQFLQVGKPGKERLARLRGADKLRPYELTVDRDAGCVIIWAADDPPRWNRICSFIWWLDERKQGNMVYSRTRELITSWSRELLERA